MASIGSYSHSLGAVSSNINEEVGYYHMHLDMKPSVHLHFTFSLLVNQLTQCCVNLAILSRKVSGFMGKSRFENHVHLNGIELWCSSSVDGRRLKWLTWLLPSSVYTVVK